MRNILTDKNAGIAAAALCHAFTALATLETTLQALY